MQDKKNINDARSLFRYMDHLLGQFQKDELEKIIKEIQALDKILKTAWNVSYKLQNELGFKRSKKHSKVPGEPSNPKQR